MSSGPTEWKTVRIKAETYFKLNELVGLLTFISGVPMPLSHLVGAATSHFYDKAVPTLKEIINDSEELHKIRRRVIEDLQDLSDQELYQEYLKWVSPK